jgi:hypothetical protein
VGLDAVLPELRARTLPGYESRFALIGDNVAPIETLLEAGEEGNPGDRGLGDAGKCEDVAEVCGKGDAGNVPLVRT